MSIPDPDRARIHAEAQRARAAEISRGNISKLALELLRQRLDDKNTAIVQTNRTARTRANQEHTAAVSAIERAHKKEKTEFDNAKFALFDQFHARREELVAASKAEETFVEEEESQYRAMIQSLLDKKMRIDEKVKKATRDRIHRYEKERDLPSASPSVQWERDELNEMILRVREAADSTYWERQREYARRSARHCAIWEVRKLVLKNKLRIAKTLHREARAKLEDDYQVRLREQELRGTGIQTRQTMDLEKLDRQHATTLANLQATHDEAEASLQEERQRLNEWWAHLLEEAVGSSLRSVASLILPHSHLVHSTAPH